MSLPLENIKYPRSDEVSALTTYEASDYAFNLKDFIFQFGNFQDTMRIPLQLSDNIFMSLIYDAFSFSNAFPVICVRLATEL